MPPPNIPVGLIGCGRWGRNILRDLIALGCDVAVVSHSAEDRQYARDSHARVVTDAITALPSVAGFVVATPASTHADVVTELLDYGVPIFCEKPLTTDSTRAAPLAHPANRRLFVMDKWRYHPAVERLAELVRGRELGRVSGLRTRRLQPYSTTTDTDPVWTLAPHDLSIALEVLGEIPTPQAAVAEHHAGAVIGLVGMLGPQPWHVLEVSARYPTHRREVRVLCEGGVAIFSDDDNTGVRVMRDVGDSKNDKLGEQRLPVSSELPLLRELRAFVHHLDGGPPPRSSASEGVRIVETLVSLRRLAGLDS